MKNLENLFVSGSLPQVFERGKIAFEQKKTILSIYRRGDIFEAEVKGSSMVPYKVGIDVGEEKLQAICNCPYEQGGFCKHIIAVGLAISAGEYQLTDKNSSQPGLLSFENIQDIRAQILKRKEADFLVEKMQLRLAQKHPLDSLKILLATYESGFWKKWQQGENLLLAFLVSHSLPTSLAKEMITLIFDRWRKYEGSFQKKEDALTFVLADWGQILTQIAKEDVPRRFLHIRLQGYGLTEENLKK